MMRPEAPVIQRLASQSWDAIVIGAGPAGGVAAHQLATAGKAVLLIERRAWRRFKICGGCLNGRVLEGLEQAGLSDAVSRAAPSPLNTLRLHAEGAVLDLPLQNQTAIARDRFDAALASTAVTAGALFLTETEAVIAPHRTQNLRRVDLISHGRQLGSLHARVVLACDGINHASLHRLPESRSKHGWRGRIGLGGVIQCGTSVAHHDLWMVVGRRGYAGMVRRADGRINLAAAVDCPWLKECGSPSRALESIFLEGGVQPPAALREAQLHGTPPLTHCLLRPYGERLLVLGDAAGYVEPFTGEGMAWAIMAALTAVPLVLEGMVRWSDSIGLQWHSLLRREVWRHQRWCRAASWFLRHPKLAAHVVRLARVSPAACAAFLRHLDRPSRSPAGVVG